MKEAIGLNPLCIDNLFRKMADEKERKEIPEQAYFGEFT